MRVLPVHADGVVRGRVHVLARAQVRACVRACVRVCVSACVACLWSKRSMRATKMPGMTMSPRPSIEKGIGDTPRAWGGAGGGGGGGGGGGRRVGEWVSG